MMTMHNLKHLPENSIYVGHIDECCLHDDSEYNGDEKMVSGHLFYSDRKKSFYFFSVFVIGKPLPSYDYSEEHKLHTWKCEDGFNPLNPTLAQMLVVLESRYCTTLQEIANMDCEKEDICTLEDIWMINDKTQMHYEKAIIL